MGQLETETAQEPKVGGRCLVGSPVRARDLGGNDVAGLARIR